MRGDRDTCQGASFHGEGPHPNVDSLTSVGVTDVVFHPGDLHIADFIDASVKPSAGIKTDPGKIPHHLDRKSTRLNSSHVAISYAVFCLKKKTTLILRIAGDGSQRGIGVICANSTA